MKSYIFDLYGTLIDIHTEYQRFSVWKGLADMYMCYGAVYTSKQLKETYFRIDREEWEKAEMERPGIFVDIQFKNILQRLYDEAPVHIRGSNPICDQNTWLLWMENYFRKLTRVRCRPYRNTVSVLQYLRKTGNQIILLSNAQRSSALTEMGICKISNYFDKIYISADYGIRKPEKLFMETVLRENALSPQDCLMIGNEMNSDMLVAAKCHIRGIYLNTGQYPLKQIQQALHALQEIYPDFLCDVIESGNIRDIQEKDYADMAERCSIL